MDSFFTQEEYIDIRKKQFVELLLNKKNEISYYQLYEIQKQIDMLNNNIENKNSSFLDNFFQKIDVLEIQKLFNVKYKNNL